MKKLSKPEQRAQDWIVENYKYNAEYNLLECKEHGVFAMLKPETICPNCKVQCEIYNNTLEQ